MMEMREHNKELLTFALLAAKCQGDQLGLFRWAKQAA